VPRLELVDELDVAQVQRVPVPHREGDAQVVLRAGGDLRVLTYGDRALLLHVKKGAHGEVDRALDVSVR